MQRFNSNLTTASVRDEAAGVGQEEVPEIPAAPIGANGRLTRPFLVGLRYELSVKLKFQPGDCLTMDFVGAVGEAQGARARPGVG